MAAAPGGGAKAPRDISHLLNEVHPATMRKILVEKSDWSTWWEDPMNRVGVVAAAIVMVMGFYGLYWHCQRMSSPAREKRREKLLEAFGGNSKPTRTAANATIPKEHI